MIIPITLGALLGATALNGFPTLPFPSGTIACLGLTAIGGLCLGSYLHCKPIWRFFLALVIGWSWAYWRASEQLDWHLPQKDWGKAVVVEGRIEKITQWRQGTLQCDVQLRVYQESLLRSHPKVRVVWAKSANTVSVGDKVTLRVKLKPPWHFANPGGLDQERLLFLSKIRATGRVEALLQQEKNALFSVRGWREALSHHMQALLPGQPFLGVIRALTLGMPEQITPEQWQFFHATGTSHAMAISGLHIGLVALLLGGVGTFLARQSVFLTTRWPARCYGGLLGLFGALLYSALAGFSVPTQRALAMVLVGTCALWARRDILTWHSLAIACLGVLLWDPLVTLQWGFWLSFGCVAALVYGRSHASDRGFVRRWLAPQCVVWVGLLPLSAVFFQQVPLFSPLANMVLLPMMHGVIVPFSLMGMMCLTCSDPLAQFFFVMAHTAFSGVAFVLSKLAAVSGSVWYLSQIPWPLLLFGSLGSALCLAPRGVPFRLGGVFLLIPLLVYRSPTLPSRTCRLTVLDVGQGLSCVVQTRHHTLLYDAGPVYSQKEDAGKRVIQPFLRARSIRSLDKIVISHPDLDHRGGLPSLLTWPIGEIMTSHPWDLPVSARACLAGERWEWDGVLFEFLHPQRLPAFAARKRNNHSCVLKVTLGTHSFLLTGDIEKSAERLLLALHAEKIPSTLLVVPHHGSLSSSSNAFVQKVAPKYALYAMGLGNHYGFPKQNILERYQAVGSQNLLIPQTGAVVFQMDAKSPPHLLHAWRHATKRYWHTQWDGK